MAQWVEQRQNVRQLTDIDGTLATNNGLVRIPVRVVNLSRAGAMVELPDVIDIPEQILLLFNHRIEVCKLVWHEGNLAGFYFVAA